MPRSSLPLGVLAAAFCGPGSLHPAPLAAQPAADSTATAIVASANAADTTRLVIPQLAPGDVVDGRVPPAVWNRLPIFPMTEHSPQYGAEPSERTEIRIAHDGRYVYFSARMYDRNPAGIQAPSLRRDMIPHTNDFFGILLDSFLDRQTAHGFWTNPVGLRTDLLTVNDATGSGAYNYNWDAFWDVHPARSGAGWFTEVRIPFSSLRFQPVDGEVEMGLIVYRRIARKNEWITFPAIEQRWGPTSLFKPSNARRVVFEDVEQPRLLQFTPYVLAGGERTRAEPAAPSAGWGAPVWRRALEAGFDVKAGLTPNLTLDLAVNPDFAQVEADDQRVNLTRFSLFFPEKRPFFQERSSAFEFATGQRDRLFYSRRIGLEGGAAVRLYGGARVAGRIGGWDVGALTVQSEATGAGSDLGVNYSVARVSRTVLNPSSYVATMVTSRLEGRGRSNVAYCVDGQLRLGTTDYLTMQWAQTFDSEVDDARVLDAGLARARLERRTNRGVLYDLNAKWVGARHLPALGFLRQRGYVRIGDRIGFGWTPGPGARYQSQTLQLRASALRRTEDGVLESVEVGPSWSLTTPGGYRYSLEATQQREDLDRPFTLPGGNLIPAGTHSYGRVGIGFRTPGGDLRGVSVDVEGGSLFHGHSIGVSVSPRANLGAHLELRGRYRFDRLRFPDGPGLDAHVARLRLDHQVSVHTSWSSFIQYNSATDAMVANVRLRYNPREGNEFYLVYNADMNTGHFDDAATPLLPGQTLLLKVSLTAAPWL